MSFCERAMKSIRAERNCHFTDPGFTLMGYNSMLLRRGTTAVSLTRLNPSRKSGPFYTSLIGSAFSARLLWYVPKILFISEIAYKLETSYYLRHYGFILKHLQMIEHSALGCLCFICYIFFLGHKARLALNCQPLRYVTAGWLITVQV